MSYKILDDFSIDEMWPHIQYLGSFDKTSGTQGEFNAVKYLSEQLDKYGVSFKINEFKSYLSYPWVGKVEWTVSGVSKKIEAKTRSFSANTSEEGISGNVIYVPGGKDMFTDMDTLAAMEQMDLKGKIVLSEGGGRQNMIFAQNKGALGYIHMWPSDEDVIHEGIVTSIWGGPTPEKIDKLLKIPVLGIKNKDGVEIKDRLASGAEVSMNIYSKTENGWRRQLLLEATIPGENDEFVLVGGHLDSWHNGATDNVSGNVACLEIARVLQLNKDKLKRGVKVCWWPGHSTGRYAGSTWYCDNNWFSLHEKCIGYINIDSPGPKGANDFSEITAVPEVEAFEKEIVEAITGQIPVCERPVRAGDQSFWGPGVTSMYMLLSNLPKEKRARVGGSGYAWWWHSEHDTTDKIGKDELLRDTKIYGLSAFRLATESVIPFDINATVKDIVKSIEIWEEKGKNLFDLSPVKEELKLLDEKVSKFVTKEGKDADFNSTLVEALKHLTRISFTESGPFEHDPAVPTPPVPALQDITKLPDLCGYPFPGYYLRQKEMAGFVFTKLVRERNKVIYGIKQARCVIEGYLKES